VNAPKATIGLPVYNGKDTIEECLCSLEGQTMREFRVLIYDNASTDGTSEICADFARRDSRFVHFRQAENVGSGQNFLDVLDACETDYFAWRADDDLSSPDFIGRMQALLDADPRAVLAVAHVESRRPAKGRVKHAAYVRAWPGVPRMVNILRKMFLSHASWVYGLWRTGALRDYYMTTWEKHPMGWANDHLVILNAILDGGVVGDERARFIQRIGIPGADRATRTVAAASPSLTEDYFAEMRQEMLRYRALCREIVAARDWSGFERRILDLVIDRYADKRINISEKKMWLIRMRQRLLGRA